MISEDPREKHTSKDEAFLFRYLHYYQLISVSVTLGINYAILNDFKALFEA